MDEASLGGSTRHGDLHNPGILSTVRDGWPSRKPDDLLEAKLAFVLGWITHRAADRQMKPIWRRDLPNEKATGSPTDCSIYHDVFILKNVYGAGTEGFFAGVDAEHLQASDSNRVEQALSATWRRMLITIHTFIPDDENAEQWLENVMKARQSLSVDLKRYAEALAAPDAEKWKRYIDDLNFFDESDPALALALGKPGGQAVLDGALEPSQNQSYYAQALVKAACYVRAASAYFTRDIDIDTMSERLDIGRPEVDF